MLSAIFNFQSLLVAFLLLICTTTYLRLCLEWTKIVPAQNQEGFHGALWKLSRIGERASPWVATGCLLMAGSLLFSSD
ncbi:MAG: DUF1242 domain-containing protein [archaeon]|nr:DUF1242 domain-containing protein [archaeon]